MPRGATYSPGMASAPVTHGEYHLPANVAAYRGCGPAEVAPLPLHGCQFEGIVGARSADGEICPGDQFQHRGEFSRVLEFCRPPPQERVCLGVAARDNRIAK